MLLRRVGRAHLTQGSLDLLRGKAVKSVLCFMTCFREKGVTGKSKSPSSASIVFLKPLILRYPVCHVLDQCVLTPVGSPPWLR